MEILKDLFSSYEEYDSLEEIEKVYNNCTECKLYENRKELPCVIPYNNQRVMVVSDWPHSGETLKITSTEGSLLKVFLQENPIQIKQEHIYYTHLIGCPYDDERIYNKIIPNECFEKCQPRIESLIQVISPQILVLVGLQVMIRLLGHQGSNFVAHEFQYLGKHNYKGITTYAIPHPIVLKNMLELGSGKEDHNKFLQIMTDNLKLIQKEYKSAVKA